MNMGEKGFKRAIELIMNELSDRLKNEIKITVQTPELEVILDEILDEIKQGILGG